MTELEHVKELLVDYLQGELSQQHVIDIERHLRDCSICREEKILFANILKGAKSHQYPDPGKKYWDGFSDRFHARLELSQALESVQNSKQAIVPDTDNNIVEFTKKNDVSRGLWPKKLAAVAIVTLVIGAMLVFNGSPNTSVAKFNIALSQKNIMGTGLSYQEYRQHADNTLAVLHSEEASPNLFAFAPARKETNFFSIGTHFAQIFAAISNNNRIAIKLATLLNHDLETLDQPSIQSAMKKLQININDSLSVSASDDVAKTRFKNRNKELAFKLQESFEQYFLSLDKDHAATLFYTGAWLYNIELASIVKNTNAVQEREIFASLIEGLTRMEIEPGVTRSLDKIENVLTKNKPQNINDIELKIVIDDAINKELNNIRNVLAYR